MEFITNVERKQAEGADVRAARLSLHLSQDDFADLFGFTAISVTRWERGKLVKMNRFMNVVVLMLNKVVGHCRKDLLLEALKSFRKDEDDVGLIRYLSQLEVQIDLNKQRAIEESLQKPYLKPSPVKRFED